MPSNTSDYLLRFRADLSQVEAELTRFSAKSQSAIQRVANIPVGGTVPPIPQPGPGLAKETPQSQARAFGAARQSVIGPGRLGDLTKAERAAIEDDIAKSFSGGKYGYSGFVKSLGRQQQGFDETTFKKYANQGGRMAQDIYKSEQDVVVANEKVAAKLAEKSTVITQQTIKQQEQEAARLAKEAEIAAKKQAKEQEAIARQEAAERARAEATIQRTVATKQNRLAATTDPQVVQSEAQLQAQLAADRSAARAARAAQTKADKLANASNPVLLQTDKDIKAQQLANKNAILSDPNVQANEAIKTQLQAEKAERDRVIKAAAHRAALEEEMATRSAGYYQIEGEFEAQVQVENQRILAAKRVAFNNALLANNGALLKVVGQGEVADMSSAAAIHGERARQLLNDPATTKQIVNDDTVTRKEAAIREAQVAENLANDKAYTDAKIQGTAAHKQEAAVIEAGVSEKLAADDKYIAAVLKAAKAREVERLAVLEATTATDIARAGNLAAQESIQKTQIKIQELEVLSSEENLTLKAQANVAQRAYNKAIREATAVELENSGQKLAAFGVRYGRGGASGGSGATDSLGGAFGAGAFSSLTHILPTLALFAAAGGVVSAVKDAQELEVKLTNINFQLNAAGQGDSFKRVKKDILDLATETGIASTKIAEIRYQVQGAFGGGTKLNGLSGESLVNAQTDSVAKISALTGFDSQQVIDNVTAVGLAFNVTGEQIGNAAFQLEQKFGVRSQETIGFLGEIAPVAKQAGFSLQEFGTIAAVAQQRSGQSGTAIAEKFSRVITGIAEKKKDLVDITAGNDLLRSNDKFVQAINVNDVRGIIIELGKVFNQLDTVTQDKLSNVLGGPRNFQAILPALQAGDIAKQAEGVDVNDNTLERRFEKFNETFGQQAKQFGEALKQIGIALYDAGLKDALTLVVGALKLVGEVLTPVVKLFSSLNESLNGIPAKLILIAGALKLITNSNAMNSLLGFGSAFGKGATGGANSPFGNGQALAAITAQPTTFGHSISEQIYGPPPPSATGLPPATRQTIAPPPSTGSVPIVIPSDVVKDAGDAVDDVAVHGRGLAGSMKAARGKFSEMTSKLPTGLVVAAAAFALVKLAETVNEVRANSETARIGLADKITSEVDPIKRQRLIDQAKAASDQFNPLERNLFGYDTAPAAELAQRRLAAPGLQGGAEAILGFNKTVKGGVAQPLQEQAGKLQKALDTLKTDSGNEDAQKSINEVMEYYKKLDPAFYDSVIKPAIDKALAEAQANREKNGIDQTNQDNIKKASEDLESVLADYANGDATILDVKRAYESSIQTYERATASGSDPDLIKELRKKKAAEGKFYSKELRSSNAISNEYNALVKSPEETGNFLVSQDLSLLNNPAFTDKEERLSVAKEIVSTQEKIYKAKLDNFTTATEALAYLQSNPPKIDTESHIAIIEAGLNQSNEAYAEFLETYKLFFGDSGEAFIKSLVRSVVQGDKTVEQVIAELEVKKAEAIKAAGGWTDTSGFDKAIDLFKKLDKEGQFDNTQDTTEETKKLTEKAHTEAVARIKAQFDVQKSLINGDSVATAQIAAQEAQALLAIATKPEEVSQYTAQLNQAKQQIANALKARFLSNFDVIKSTLDEPSAIAAVEVQKAEAALANATPDERNGAIANLNAAKKQQRQAFIADEDARAEFAKALVAGDPIKSARLAQSEAQRKFREATTGAERLRAFADKIKADQEFSNAVSALYDSQAAVATALAEFRGDKVESSRIAYNQAVRHLQEIRNKFNQGQASEADVNNAQAQVTQAQGQLRDSQLQKQLDDYSFLYDMDKISKGQYIAYLERLKNLPDLTEDQLHSIDRQIKGLKAELAQDLQFNVPNEIKLPTLYEARRLNQSSGGYGEKGSGSYNDNRVITIEVNITDGQSKKDVLNAINDAVASGPQRFSNGVRSY